LGVPAGLLIWVLALLILLPGIQAGLVDRDEGWYAQVCREMIETGDWLVPRYLGRVWLAKPPLTYWLVAGSFSWLGIGEWQARLVPVLASSLNVVLVASLGAALFGRRAGLLAGVLFVTAGLPAIVGRMLLTDPVMLLCTLAAVRLHWSMAQAAGAGRVPHLLAAGYWLFIGLGVLAKGPATLVFAGAFGLALLTTPGRRAWLWDRRYWAWLPVAVLVAVPWYAYIYRQAGGTFIRQFLGYEIVERLAGTPHGHGGPPGYYLLLSLAGLLPWTPLVPGALVIAFHRRRENHPWRPLLVWMAVPWLILELIHSKLPHYILPAYVPLLILLAGSLDESLRIRRVWADLADDERRALNLWVGVARIIGAAFALTGLVLSVTAGPPAAGAALAATGLVLLAGFAFAARLMRRRSLVSAGVAAVVTMVLFHATLGLGLLPAWEPTRLSRNLARAIDAAAGDARPVYVCGYEEPSTFFYLRTPTTTLEPGSLAELATTAPDGALLAVTQRVLDRLSPEIAETLKPRMLPETVRGFNYVKMSSETIRLVRFRRQVVTSD
jgi:4-amino-4-deoxy-L-arabinose transferase-like glycosyltransferase